MLYFTAVDVQVCIYTHTHTQYFVQLNRHFIVCSDNIEHLMVINFGKLKKQTNVQHHI